MTQFTLTDNHLKLLKNANVSWNFVEYGSPSIDGKRPYGNSDVESDIIKILFGDIPEEAQESLLDYARQLHEETAKALQICLSTQKFEAGTYVKPDYKNEWRKK